MKKFLFIIFTLTLCLFAVSFEKQEISANTESKGDLVSTEIEYLEDGTYLVKEQYSIQENSKARSNFRVVTHRTVVTQYSAADTVLWIFELIGDWFVEDGVSVQASASVINSTVNDRSWHFSLGNQTYYDNIVHGDGVYKHKLLGITTKTVNLDINMECDVYGNLVEEE